MKQNPSLLFCIFLDLLGNISYLLPFAGEWFDVAWAPFSAWIFYRMFGGRTGKIGALISFTEEIIPFVDIIPTFTLGYFYKKFFDNKTPEANNHPL